MPMDIVYINYFDNYWPRKKKRLLLARKTALCGPAYWQSYSFNIEQVEGGLDRDFFLIVWPNTGERPRLSLSNPPCAEQDPANPAEYLLKLQITSLFFYTTSDGQNGGYTVFGDNFMYREVNFS